MITPPWMAGTVPAAKKTKVAVFSPALPPKEEVPVGPAKDRLEAFAREYIKDFCQKRAAMRMGYSQSYASTEGGNMFWHSYTQAYLVSLIRDLEEHCIVGRNQVLAGLLLEANSFAVDANSSSRISAWKEIGKILGMYIVKVEISAHSSGVMEVPMVRNAEEWEALAHSSQTVLLANARN